MGLEGTPVIQPSTGGAECTDLDVVKEEVEFRDGCPVLPKLQIHVTKRGVCATLEKVIRDSNGNPVDLSNCMCSPAGSISESGDEVGCGVVVRFMEATGFFPSDPIYEEQAQVIDAANGIVRVTLPAAMVECPAIYKESWAVYEGTGNLSFIDEGWLIIENSLFGITEISERNYGPPSIEELRLGIRDNAPSENVLLDDVEFSDMEIGYALLRPIREFEEVNPPLNTHFNTKTFPFKEHWIKGTQAYLYSMAEAWYRRNRLGTSAGGISIDPENKEREYLRAYKLLVDEWREFMKMKKVEMNAAAFTGRVGSTYGHRLR